MLARSFVLLALSVAAAAQAPSDADIRAILSKRIDTTFRGVVMVVGVTDPSNRRVVTYGKFTDGDPDGDTVFEIGSISKAFTSLLLTDMVQRGEVKLSDPVAKYLPAGAKMPERGGKVITLEDLATQVSGLPRLPGNFSPKDGANPYADYTPQRLYAFLSTYKLPRDIGAEWEYSNLGVGLLGHVLSLRAHTDYDALVRARIAEPLGMKSTRVALTPELAKHLAPGHDGGLKPVPNWDFDALAGAGALRSTANDMLTFLAANLGFMKPPANLAAAMSAMLKVRRPAAQTGMEQALGWQVSKLGGDEIVWKDGGTYGYSSFIGYNPRTRTGAVVLANEFTTLNDIGMQLLDPTHSVLRDHKTVTVDPKLYDRYTGDYQLAPGAILTVTREGERLMVQLTGQPKFEIYPETERDFFLKVVEASLTFDAKGEGPASAVILHQNGLNQTATRLVGDAPRPKQHKQVAIDPKLLDSYVGKYQLMPDFIMTITREGSHLFLQATGQPKLEIYPESDRDFFLTVVDAQITFEVDGTGIAKSLVLHQGGNQRAKRVD